MNLYLKTKDYSVSGESFELHLDPEYELLKTIPIPANLDKYYQSEDYISHTDAKGSLFEKIYYLVKQYTLYRKEKIVSSLSKPIRYRSRNRRFFELCKQEKMENNRIRTKPKSKKISTKKRRFVSRKHI